MAAGSQQGPRAAAGPGVCWVLAGQVNAKSQDVLCEEFLSGDLTKPEFLKYFNEVTRDYGFLVINNTSVKSGDINEIYGSVRAEL